MQNRSHEPALGTPLQIHGDMPEHEEMTPDERLNMIRQQRAKWLWTNFTNIALGVWLITSPITFGYMSAAMTWSDILSGVLIVLFGVLSLSPRLDFWGRWAVCFVGLWLQFAPLVFWAPTAIAYVNNTLIGALVIAFSILIPMMPGISHHIVMMKPGPEMPLGWTYNPSSWPQRAPLIALAVIGWFISRYLAAVQLGYIEHAWDPFFGEGTRRVLFSEVSQAFPISDAGLGAVAYTLEVLMGSMGGTRRWRTMPWMVTFFGLLVVPLGITHIVLVILQPVVVGYWCTLCLAAAFVMLLMIPLAVDEVVAMGQFMRQRVQAGEPFWHAFWVGGTLQAEHIDRRTPRYGAPISAMGSAMIWGMTLPWHLLLSAALGLWIMVAPVIFGSQGAAAGSDHVVGALVVTVAVISTAEVLRVGRFLNLLLGAWLIAAPWLLSGAVASARWNGLIVGIALMLLSLPRGVVRERYGSWDRSIF